MAEAAALLLILSLAAYLRLANRADNPGWYSDEGTHIDIAMNLMEGRAQSLAITQSMLLVARPPLFHLLLAFFAAEENLDESSHAGKAFDDIEDILQVVPNVSHTILLRMNWSWWPQ
mgnify:CR=1 FL=1